MTESVVPRRVAVPLAAALSFDRGVAADSGVVDVVVTVAGRRRILRDGCRVAVVLEASAAVQPDVERFIARLGAILDDRDVTSLHVVDGDGVRCLVEPGAPSSLSAFASRHLVHTKTSGMVEGDAPLAGLMRTMLEVGVGVTKEPDDRKPIILVITGSTDVGMPRESRVAFDGIAALVPQETRLVLLGTRAAGPVLTHIERDRRRLFMRRNSCVGTIACARSELDGVILDALGMRWARAGDELKVLLLPASGWSLEHLAGGVGRVTSDGLTLEVAVVPPLGEIRFALRLRSRQRPSGRQELLRCELHIRRVDGLLVRSTPPPVEATWPADETASERTARVRVAACIADGLSESVVVVARPNGDIILPWTPRVTASADAIGEGLGGIPLASDARVEHGLGRVRVCPRRELTFQAPPPVDLDDEGYVLPGAKTNKV